MTGTTTAVAHSNAPIEHQFNPYTDNGGTVLGIAGEDFALLAGDTRQSNGYSINSRYMPQVFEIGDGMIMSANGFAADGKALLETIQTQIEWYHHNHNKKMAIKSAARMIQQELYKKRFFPYYCQTIIGGLDSEGKGAIYSYDYVGSYEREQSRAVGGGASLITPFLDCEVNFKNQVDPETGKSVPPVPLKLEEALKLAVDAFTSVTERNIHDGDELEILIVTKNGIERRNFPLKRD